MSTTETAKHTPGPWAVDPDRFWIRSEVEQSIVATVEKDLHHKGEQDANADLIAAAPELLAALEACLPNVPGWDAEDFAGRPWLEQAAAAIRKAKGEL